MVHGSFMRWVLTTLILGLWVVTGLSGGALAQNSRPSVEAPATFGAAIRWYKKAAEDGSAKAQFLLGSMLEAGKGKPRGNAKQKA